MILDITGGTMYLPIAYTLISLSINLQWFYVGTEVGTYGFPNVTRSEICWAVCL